MKKWTIIGAVFLFWGTWAHAEGLAVIKSTTNRGETNVGDYWIAEDFAAGFRALGQMTAVDYRGEYQNKHVPAPSFSLYMRGYTKFETPFDEGTNILYVYYPMTYHADSGRKADKAALQRRKKLPLNSSLDDDWRNFDVIAVASPTYAATLRAHGINAVYVPQFTNPERFYPAPDDNLRTDILFVGSNWHERTSLRYAIESGFQVAVYGYHWEGIVPAEMYKAVYIPNDDLNRYYSSAKIVLNDHRPDMKEFGFVNNRIYDATAAGALVISDYMPEIAEAYGDSIPMYKNREELAALLHYYLHNEAARLEKAAQARRMTLDKFTHIAAAKAILAQLSRGKEK